MDVHFFVDAVTVLVYHARHNYFARMQYNQSIVCWLQDVISGRNKTLLALDLQDRQYQILLKQHIFDTVGTSLRSENS